METGEMETKCSDQGTGNRIWS